MEDTKICRKCNFDKPRSEFIRNKRNKDGYTTLCKKCTNVEWNIWYWKNRDKVIKQDKESRDKLRRLTLRYLLSHPCVDCRETNPLLLCFDHVRGEKVYEVSYMVDHKWAETKVVEEISKCDIRCYNCHHLRHSKERDYWKEALLEELLAEKF